jgi:hypothetical protein
LADARTDGGENATQHRDKQQLNRIARMSIFGDYVTGHGTNNRAHTAQPTMNEDLTFAHLCYASVPRDGGEHRDMHHAA